ncbi:hypothetical protein INT47_010512 [Mucor saturninus]|uniref:Sel1 repeat family protein n=1 Tax=Mucor saturninus TaxID=64648 RepID=A0A8H7RCV4_9FUNG|nr:hypothetical protein INT47_010512 [Mucor saturninus]
MGWHVPKDYVEAIKYYTCAAHRGAQDAQYRLGLIYLCGKVGVNVNYREAFSWFQKASETTAFVPKLTWLDGAIPKDEMYSRDKAEHYLGKIYLFGLGVAVNPDLALHWFTKSAENENALSQYDLALLYYEEEGSPESRNLSLEWIQKAAHNNHTEAQYIMGIYNYFGRDNAKDDDRARYWFNRAIKTNGHPEAWKCIIAMDRNQRVEFNNSPFFRHLNQSIASTSDDNESDDESSSGISVSASSDYKTEEDEVSQQNSAQKLLQELKYKAEKGDSDAQNKLGEALRDNQEDTHQSFTWFLKSANNGNARGLYNLGNCFYEGIGVQKSHGDAFDRFQDSAKKHDKDAQFMLGEFYRHGYGSLSIDYCVAQSWYLKSARQGHGKAQYELGNLYLLEDYKDKDMSSGFFWYSKSAKQGNSDAQYKVGVCYVEGFFVQKDYHKARAKFLLAIENGNMDALLSIGMMYQKGLGVSIDYKEALKYYEAAAEKDYDKALLSINNLKDIMCKASDDQKTVFKSGTEQFFHVGELINALPETNKIIEASSEKDSIIEERRESAVFLHIEDRKKSAIFLHVEEKNQSAVFLHVEDHSVKVKKDTENPTKTKTIDVTKFSAYKKEEESAKFFHIDNKEGHVTYAREQPAVFMHVEDTSLNDSEKKEQSAKFLHIENVGISITESFRQTLQALSEKNSSVKKNTPYRARRKAIRK